MATILCIESSTAVCSTALAVDGKIIALQESTQLHVHAEKLVVFIKVVLEQAGIPISKLDAVAVGTGPGSYTGLRIGASTAKGLCYAIERPLIAAPTLKAMAMAAAAEIGCKDIFYCPMIDARRLEVYTAIYDCKGEEILGVEAKILDKDSFTMFSEQKPIAFFGDGMPKMRGLSDPGDVSKIWLDNIYTSSKNLVPLAELAYSAKQFAHVAYYEPFYLKDFVAKKKIPA